jgi:hypothetical protein
VWVSLFEHSLRRAPLLHLFFYRQQRAHQQPRSGRHTKVRPYLQVGPATRQATVSIGEKFPAAERSPDAPLPVIASAVKTPATSINEAANKANAYLRMSPSQEEEAPRVERGLRC